MRLSILRDSGTIFHDTHLASQVFLAVFLICQSRKGMSANQLCRMLRIITVPRVSVPSNPSRNGEAQPKKLDGTVEMDETYVGGKRSGKVSTLPSKRKRSSLAFVSATAICDSSMHRMPSRARWRSTSREH